MDKYNTINEFIFTRYLYEKEEVEYSFIMTLLNKKEECLFWAYELFHSGFKKQLIDLFWLIYFDFYATLNPSYENYLLQKLNKTQQLEEKMVSVIVNNFMIRPSNFDVYILRKIVNSFEINNDYSFISKEEIIIDLLIKNNFINISNFILHLTDDIDIPKLYDVCIGYFENVFKKNNMDNKFKKYKKKELIEKELVTKKHMLLSKIVGLSSLLNDLKMGKSMYVSLKDEDIVMYETVEVDLNCQLNSYSSILPARKILEFACLFSIDENNYLSLFSLKREKKNIKESYLNNWLYHASFSPIWMERLKKYNAIVDYDKKTIVFINDDLEEEFYTNYGLEPDEQKIIIQNKCIQNLNKKNTWLKIISNKKNSILEEEDIIDYLEEL
jgi:hypothetical protein